MDQRSLLASLIGCTNKLHELVTYEVLAWEHKGKFVFLLL